MKDTFRTIKKSTHGIYREKGSKFLSFAFPVENEVQIEEYLNNLKKEYYDARHHCFAYILGREADIFRSNDDGEPRHTAGDPILNQIRSYNITNVLLVVVRYFGGTKLGKSGLIQAYKTTAADALEKAEIIEITLEEILRLYFDYSILNEIMKYISEKNLNLTDQQYGNKTCMIEIKVRQSESRYIQDQIHSRNLATKIERLSG